MAHIKLVMVLALCLGVAVDVPAQQAQWNELNQTVNKLYQQGKYAEGTKIAERALEVGRKTFGPDHVNVGYSLAWLAALYRAQGKYAEAEPLFIRSLTINEKALGKDHPGVAGSLNNLALLYNAQGRYAEAEPLFNRSLAIREKALGPDHPDVAASLNNLAQLYQSQGKYAEAEPLYKRSLAINEKALGKDHSDVAHPLDNLAALYRQQGKYAEAEPLYKRSLAIYEKAMGKDHPDVATSLNDLALLYLAQGKYAEAEPLFKRSLAIYEKALGKDHPNVGTSLAGLAELYRAQGKYADAEPLYKRSLEILEKALGKDHPSVAQALNNLAGLYQLQGKYSDAEPLFNRGLAIREKALGKDHPDVAESANNLAVVYQSQGKYADAEPLYKRSLEINEKALGKDHPQVATALNNLAGLYQSQGKYADAEPLFYMSLEIKEKALGKDHPNVAISLNNLAVLYRKQGKHSDAEPLYKRSLQVFEKALGKDHPDVAAFLNNLGGLYQDKGDYAEALRMFQESLEISKKKGLPLDNPQNLIANLYLDQGEVTKAEPIIAEAGENRTRARLCLMKKDFQKAKDYYDGDRILAEENRNADYLFSAYTGLGIASEGLGDDIHAAEYYRQAVDFTEDLRSSLSRDDRDKFFDVKVNGLYRTAPYEGLARVLTKLNKPEDALKESEYAKARIFAEWLSRKSEGSAPQVPKDVTDKDSQLNERLAALTRNLQEAYGKANKEVITVLKPQVGEAKDKLAAHVDMLRKQYPLFAATKYPHPMVLAQTDLKENEWVLAYHVTDPGIIIYLTRGKILIRGLFKPIPRKDVDELVRKFLQPMELGPDDSITEKLGKFDFGSGNELADLLLADILPDIPKNTPLIIIPDGSLGVVPFEMLVLNDGGKIVTDDKRPQTSGAEFFGDRNPISYYQSITALTLARTLGKQKKTQDRLLVIADPVFEMKDARAQGKKSETKLTGTEASFYEDLMASVEEGKVGGLRFTRLPLTGELAENLSTSFKGACTLYTGLKANKDTFMKEVVPSLGDYSKVVFATHGYFGKGLPGINEPVLVFTLVPPGTDGYLRMSEVMGLKMNADMVALTACQTGLGKELSGEGVMGMGRAFQFAGAKSVLMSLWSVSEKSSTTLVENFFKNLKDGKNKLEALKLAREDIRQQGYDHPFYWAGFILVGEVN